MIEVFFSFKPTEQPQWFTKYSLLAMAMVARLCARRPSVVVVAVSVVLLVFDSSQ